MKKLVFVLTLLLTSKSYSKLISVSCSGADCNNAAVQSLITSLENDLNADLPDTDQSGYLTGMADASIASQKGVGVDYINDIDVFIVGLGIGVGAHVGENTFSDLTSGDLKGEQLKGIGFAPSVMLGIDLGMFDLPRWEFFDFNKIKLMVNFFSFKKDDSDVNAKMTNFGIHARYKILDDMAFLPAKMAHWHGLNLMTGFEYNSLELAYFNTENTSFTDSGVTANIQGSIKVGAKLNTTSIPVAVSTGVTLGYVFSLYGGIGADFNFGSSESIANVNAPISVSGGGVSDANLNASFDLSQKDGPSAVIPRAFLGFQLGVPIWKPITVQLDKGLKEGLYTLSASTKVTW